MNAQAEHIYHGHADGRVTVGGVRLNMRREVRNYASEFEWGYPPHPGADQLALAILCHHFEDVNRALIYVSAFKWNVLCHLPADRPWTLRTAEINAALRSIDKEIETRARLTMEGGDANLDTAITLSRGSRAVKSQKPRTRGGGPPRRPRGPAS